MAEKPSVPSQDAASASSRSSSSHNPALRMMGLPNLRLKLPSRNWLIFLSITSSFTAALIYDRHHRKKAQQKWCSAVSHVAKEPLALNQMPRKLTILLAAPPGDGLRSAREYFQEYVKPVLVAAALDWDVIEGRREGDIRAKLVERIRRDRLRHGEMSMNSERTEKEGRGDIDDAIEETRQKAGIREWAGFRGDLVIGRHTWKEYIRGLHEGWLGPLEPLPDPSTAPPDTILPDPPLTPHSPTSSDSPALADITRSSGQSNSFSASISSSDTGSESPAPKSTFPTKSYIAPSSYAASPLPPSIPSQLPPSLPLPFPHLLGFLNTPIRIYRFLMRRHLADCIGRDVAALVLASSASIQPYEYSEKDFIPGVEVDDASPASGADKLNIPDVVKVEGGARWEQRNVLQYEENEWHKSVRKDRKAEEDRTWIDRVVLDDRIAGRMRKCNLLVEDTLKPTDETRPGEENIGKGWIETMKESIGLGKKKGEPKGWEQGFVGGETD